MLPSVSLASRKIKLNEDALAVLNMKFQMLALSLEDEPEVTFTYFKPDDRKAGGAYLTERDVVKKVDTYNRRIQMRNGTCIPMDDIFDIDLSGSETDEPQM